MILFLVTISFLSDDAPGPVNPFHFKNGGPTGNYTCIILGIRVRVRVRVRIRVNIMSS